MKPRLVKMRRAVFRRRTLAAAAICLVSLWVALSFYHSYKRLPTGLVYRGETRSVAAEDVELLIDVTYRNGNTRVIEQQIYDRVLEMIDHALRLVVLDIFLLNAHQGAEGEIYRPLSAEVTERLLTKRRTHPEMPILLITDPINDVYGGEPSPQLASLRQAGVQVVVTDLDRLRDSNPLYSGPWRTLGKWWHTPEPGGKLPNPLDSSAPPVNLRTYLRLLNFKANHRKVVLADADGSVWTTLVTSANAHDASSAHSNVALFVRGEFACQVYEAEAAVARLSGATPPFSELPDLEAFDQTGALHVSYLTESAIRDRLLAVIDGAQAGDEIDVAVFYLSHRRILRSLARAADRGARVRVVLDPNRDAFGRTKNGIPNRQSAEYLVRESHQIARDSLVRRDRPRSRIGQLHAPQPRRPQSRSQHLGASAAGILPGLRPRGLLRPDLEQPRRHPHGRVRYLPRPVAPEESGGENPGANRAGHVLALVVGASPVADVE
jgi:phosphatidylserine/phosphatidylglycerophosphate/cardiolipin synthase-like enzyme